MRPVINDSPVPPIILHGEQAIMSTDRAGGWVKPLTDAILLVLIEWTRSRSSERVLHARVASPRREVGRGRQRGGRGDARELEMEQQRALCPLVSCWWRGEWRLTSPSVAARTPIIWRDGRSRRCEMRWTRPPSGYRACLLDALHLNEQIFMQSYLSW